MKKSFSVLCLLIITILSFFACNKTTPKVIKESDTYIVVSTYNTDFVINKNTTLTDYMKYLKTHNEIEFDIQNGMVQSINGISNAIDYSSCWMLYTSDKENSAETWGTIEYKGNIYGSAIFGADTLKIKKDCLYIWVYQTF